MKQLLILYMFMTIGSCYAQFSGKVTYKDSYESKMSNVSSSAFENFMGTKREFYLQGAFYKDIHYGEFESVMLYCGDVNRLYSYNIGADTIFWMDALGDTLSKISNFKIEESNERILGLKCKKLTIHSRLGTSIYFFSDLYPINPTDFKSHNLNFWNFYTANCKAIPLKIIYENKDIILTSTAISIDQGKLDSELFKIPQGHLEKKF